MISKSLKAALICSLLFSLPLFAAKFWETKELTAWTEKECMELLRKSPWAQSNGFASVPAIGVSPHEMPAGSASAPDISPGFGEKESTIVFEMRLLTAKPIRMALAQLQLLQKPNDAALKEQVDKMVNEEPGKEIVIQLTYHTVPPGSSTVHDIHSYFLRSTFADFRTTTYLGSDKTNMIPVSNYLAPNERRSNAAFVFPRLNEKGEPYFSGVEKSITFRSEFSLDLRGSRQKYSIFVKFNPKDMKFQNEFAF